MDNPQRPKRAKSPARPENKGIATMPESLAAEAAVLGSMMIDPFCIPDVMAKLTVKDFYHAENAVIFQAIHSLYEANDCKGVNGLLVRQRLEDKSTLDQIGGLEYLQRVIDSTPSSAGVDYYVRIVREKSLRRQWYLLGEDLMQSSLDTSQDIEEICDEMESKLLATFDRPKDQDDLSRVPDLLMGVYEAVEKREKCHQQGIVQGLASGFHELDQMTSGFHPGDMVIIAGRPSMGKAQPLDALVLTPDGFTPMGLVRVGDSVIGADGRPHKVLGVFPQGIKQVYRVTFADGTSTECCRDHLWLTQTRNEERLGGVWSVKTCQEIAGTLVGPDGNGPNHRIPLVRGHADGDKRIRSITPTQVKPCQCIRVDAPDGLYVTNDFIVTHNTAISLNILDHIGRVLRKPVAMFSLEMDRHSLVEREICSLCEVDSNKLRRGIVSQEDYARLREAMEQLKETEIYIHDQSTLTPFQLRSRARKLKLEHNIELVMVDYLQLMHIGGKIENRQQEITTISRQLKAIARELEVPVIVLSQLNRGPEGREDHRPRMSDLRESGCLTGDSLVTVADTGCRVPIASLVGKAGFKVWAYDAEHGAVVPACCSAVFPTGNKQVYRLRTRMGKEIKATANHQFYSKKGWLRLDQLKAGDLIASHGWVPNSRGRSTKTYTTERGVVWEPIVSIEELGVQECFDMTVPDYHNMEIEGLVVHNSIEQDADVVMLLHREAYYHKGEEGWENNDDAEIIVAKQRNGPTGIVKLKFRSQFTRFDSPAEDLLASLPEPARIPEPPAPARTPGALPWEL